ncbi:MAG: hypothetical protein J7J32_02960 [Candidatus Atribacteria bacterium]|nr:hypothetical protein [Candidatus Atribacteria bacterium]MCD6350192.1 hypothetical protein [Candidatus Atribacteria bacterium]
MGKRIWIASAGSFVLMFVVVFIFCSPVFSMVSKVTIESVNLQRVAGEDFVTVYFKVLSEAQGEKVYLQASTDYENDEYFTHPLEFSCTQKEQIFTVTLRRSDFLLIDKTKNIEKELPQFVTERELVVYVYEKKLSEEDQNLTEDAKREIQEKGYALRGILAKATVSIKFESVQKEEAGN